MWSVEFVKLLSLEVIELLIRDLKQLYVPVSDVLFIFSSECKLSVIAVFKKYTSIARLLSILVSTDLNRIFLQPQSVEKLYDFIFGNCERQAAHFYSRSLNCEPVVLILAINCV